MAINEKKMQIVIDNYFKSECNVDTSIRDAFEKGFRIGVQKTVYRPKGKWIFDTGISIGGGRTSAGYVCSVCRKDYFRVDGMTFCPNCGAKMEGVE